MEVDLWEILADGGDTRKVQDLNGEGTRGISLPKDVLDDYDIGKGDSLPVDYNEEERRIEIYLP